MKALIPLVVYWVLLLAWFSHYQDDRGNRSSHRISSVAAGETVPIQNEEAHQAAPSSITQRSHPALNFSRDTSRESPPPLALTFSEASRSSDTEIRSVARPATLRLSGEVCPPEAHFRQTGVASSSKHAVGWALARESEHEQVLLQARERHVQKLRGVRDFRGEPVRFKHKKDERIECDVGCETVNQNTEGVKVDKFYVVLSPNPFKLATDTPNP